ncbi:MAG: NYN domain-containing protein [Clostridia bacterium]|nr:NYN domain-containing protein [Clostridia bacterium]
MRPLLIVDGYNVIGAWKDAEKHQWSMDEARDRLRHMLEDYSGYSGEEIVLVFDGYMSDRRLSTEERYGAVTVVFTKHAETADSYIERLTARTPRYRTVRVATSDGLEQSQVLSTGATRLTARELLRELRETRSRGFVENKTQPLTGSGRLMARIPEDILETLEDIRRGG